MSAISCVSLSQSQVIGSSPSRNKPTEEASLGCEKPQRKHLGLPSAQPGAFLPVCLVRQWHIRHCIGKELVRYFA